MSLSRSQKQYLGVRAILPPDLQVATRPPTSADKAYVRGTLWLDRTASTSWMWPGSGNWIALGSGTTGAIVTLTGGSGGALSPTAGNINLLGTANQITSTGSGSTITFSLPAAITAPGSLTTTTTLASGTTLSAGTSLTAGTTITATAGDITATLGNVIINGAAKQLRVHGGAATDFIGTSTLASGTSGAIANTNIAATDRIFIQRTAANASTTLGELSYTISAGASFTINALILGTPGSVQTGDASSVAYFIVRQV